MKRSELARMIDHTLLKPEATPTDFEALGKEAARLGTYSVCVSPSALPLSVPEGVHVATVCGFPSGAVKPQIKAAEAAQAVSDGAEEVDMVINVGNAKAGNYAQIEDEIAQVRAAIPAAVLKVIIESAALTDEQIVAVCEAAVAAGADFVKTSTGFHPAGGASEHAVALMAKTVAGKAGVKASGGIRTAEAAQKMVAAGATRLGLSASAKILQEMAD
ncbi:deoxyribose-phosphate aldolase [Winkia neuii]|uniref:deoxyribose-phosphate aldolase n=1 Tax=Winkia neuii TaxID=33007 RepID=UPI00254357CD|nr:deoxyribose-phosphate aldolase [Winkia neuii]MDU6112114.1 deoxyribose-phosphate aldolase [Winkia neuii]WIK90519.1 deoxyribose-phosphate aldolase [Winkia neuii]